LEKVSSASRGQQMRYCNKSKVIGKGEMSDLKGSVAWSITTRNMAETISTNNFQLSSPWQ
jgi:hypothetical protein